MSRQDPEGRPIDEVVRRPWAHSDRLIPRRFVRPLQSFLDTEAASGILLLGAAAAALAWANSPWADSYERLWTTPLAARVGPWSIGDDLRGWVNDGLMTFFFLVVGLEIKRELLTGELRDRRAAVLPVAAALGGMVIPALLYLALNVWGDGARGWGIVMPTDIVFTLGILALAAPGAPSALRAFVLALAIVDDLLSIVVMALFYSGGITWRWLGVAAALVALMLIAERVHIRANAVYISLGIAMWLALHEAGVTPTIAGVAMGFLTPAIPFQRPRAVSEEAHRVADETVDEPEPPDADAHHWLHLSALSWEAVSPLARIENVLHPWTSYLIVPLFALANAGVVISASALADASSDPVAIGIVVGRLLGKPLGIAGGLLLAMRLAASRLPEGVTWRHVLGVGAASGIPFTVSLFVAELAFGTPAALGGSKIGILAAASLSGIAGFAALSSGDRAGRRS